MVAEKRVDLDTDMGGAVSDPEVLLTGSHDSYDIQVTLIASSSSKAKLQLKEGRKEILVVSDGKLVRTFIPAQHEYTEVPASGANPQAVYLLHIGNNDISGIDLLREYELLFANPFQLISREESWAELEHSETLKVGKDKKECYVLMIQKPKNPQKQKLWVDKKEFTVWKSEETNQLPWDPPGATVKTTITVTIEQLTPNPSLDDSNFVFTPPDQAKKVDSLTLSGSNPF